MTLADSPQTQLATARRRPPTSVVTSRASRRSVLKHLFPFDVAVVGLGRVGLLTALAHHRAGSRVLALDVPAPSRAPDDVGPAGQDLLRLATTLGLDTFTVSPDLARAGDARAVVVCGPTPDDDDAPDVELLRALCAVVVDQAVPGQLILLTSTAYVGCTEDLLVKPLRDRGLEPGSSVHVAFSARRRIGGRGATAKEAGPRVVAGWTSASAQRAAQLVGRCEQEVHVVRTLGTAELTKLLDDTYRAVGVALDDEFDRIAPGVDTVRGSTSTTAGDTA
ncbi:MULTISPECIES: hypothetical protein [unclassified Aeromicrobium]|uniref:hypothetical protein n=1 Tax=unclassified Aeromicrobium TaxID=2633570 RepID=UPI0006FCDF79|nr:MULTISPECIES: hypothetical protein [unclassified Aeromicrobium]KQO39841.1 hypothetical protein ASF05_14430 [Aeromicrobium sp. Leaf245]KQP26001.1 hypothetical protein ASF38_10035 [Aeromicrobium sp. Leaf272]KQP78998.1 hypothetical protein ASF37_11000 [Aeromicrobium sp. Leaf289]KQP84706.1 hypothetical protein ASF35_07495 [Aeromicrobium sp. Leaf291]